MAPDDAVGQGEVFRRTHRATPRPPRPGREFSLARPGRRVIQPKSFERQRRALDGDLSWGAGISLRSDSRAGYAREGATRAESLDAFGGDHRRARPARALVCLDQ